MNYISTLKKKTSKWTQWSADIKSTQWPADIKRTLQIRATLNYKIEYISSEQIKLHRGIKSISNNSACDEGNRLYLQCLVIALCNSGYHIYPPNKC